MPDVSYIYLYRVQVGMMGSADGRDGGGAGGGPNGAIGEV